MQKSSKRRVQPLSLGDRLQLISRESAPRREADGGAQFSPRKIQEPSESQAAGELNGRRYKAVVSSVCFRLNRVIRRRAQRAADSEDNKVRQGAWQTRRLLPEERFINYANLQPSERPERNREFEVAADHASVPLSSHRGASPRKETATKALRSLDCFECLPLTSRCYLFISLSVTGDSVRRLKKKKRKKKSGWQHTLKVR